MSDYRSKIRELTDTRGPEQASEKAVRARRPTRILIAAAAAAAALTAVFFVGRAQGWWPAPASVEEPTGQSTPVSQPAPPAPTAGTAANDTSDAYTAAAEAPVQQAPEAPVQQAPEAPVQQAPEAPAQQAPEAPAQQAPEAPVPDDTQTPADHAEAEAEAATTEAEEVVAEPTVRVGVGPTRGVANTPAEAGRVLGETVAVETTEAGRVLGETVAVETTLPEENSRRTTEDVESPVLEPVAVAAPLMVPAEPLPSPTRPAVPQQTESPDVSDLRPSAQGEADPELAVAPMILPPVAEVSALRVEEEERVDDVPEAPISVLSELVLVPGGSFRFGDRGSGGTMVEVEDFYMEAHEVTNAQYKAFMEATGYDVLPRSSGPGPARYSWDGTTRTFADGTADYPVVNVSLADARAYAEWAGRRLPTEIEWEFAAESGVAGGDEALFPWPGPFADRRFANFDSGSLQPIRQYPPNSLGIYDLGGNAFEWTNSAYSGNPAASLVARNDLPRAGTSSDDVGVLRGGAFYSTYREVQIDYREANYTDIAYFGYGFRCVQDIDTSRIKDDGDDSDAEHFFHIRVGSVE